MYTTAYPRDDSFRRRVAGERQVSATYLATVPCVLDSDNDKRRRWRVCNNDKPNKSLWRGVALSSLLDAYARDRLGEC